MKQNLKRGALVVLAIMLPLGVFSPALVPVLWHLRHGDVVEYRSKRFPVPRNSYAELGHHSIEVTRPRLTVFSSRTPPVAWIVITPLANTQSGSTEDLYQRFETYYRAYRVDADDDVEKPIRLRNGEFDAVCMKKSPIKFPQEVLASCLMFEGTWTAEFVGRADEFDNFINAIRGTRSIEPAAGSPSN